MPSCPLRVRRSWMFGPHCLSECGRWSLWETVEHFSNTTLNEMAHSTMLGSLLTVWVLVGLFFYLNHYTRRRYFTIWATAWLFYALWLTQILSAPAATPRSIQFILQQLSVGISAVFLFWGSISCLN